MSTPIETAINGTRTAADPAVATDRVDEGIDVHELAQELTQARGLLRFATAGSVDDGKSTLVGRLLHDSKSVLSDTARRRRADVGRPAGLTTVDLSLLVDGLRAEREQGITIDVAYRYFATPARTFILADTPGHVQYTRNTVTGASTADLVVILTDARTGVVDADPPARGGGRAARGAAPAAGRQQDRPGRLRPGRSSTRSPPSSPPTPRISASTRSPRSRSRRCNGDNVVTRSERIGWYDRTQRARAPGKRRSDRRFRGRVRCGSRCSTSSGRGRTSCPTTAATPAGSPPARSGRATSRRAAVRPAIDGHRHRHRRRRRGSSPSRGIR